MEGAIGRTRRLVMLERFERLFEEVCEQRPTGGAAAWRATLYDRKARVADRERAMLALALEATAEAEATLRWLSTDHPRLSLLRRLAMRHCQVVRQHGRGGARRDAQAA